MGIFKKKPPVRTWSKSVDSPVVDVLCPVCGEKKQRKYYFADGVRFVRCRACRLVYQSPRPAPESLLARYDGEYFEYEIENETNFHQLMQLGLRDGGFETLFPKPKGTFLDIGCATGALLEQMKLKGWHAFGVEVCSASAQWGREHRGVEILDQPLEQCGIPDHSVDVVHSSHVIEHLSDPAGFINEVSRILKPGGFCFFTTPRIDSFQSRLFGSGWRSAIADHTVLFDRRNLNRILVQSGLTPEFWCSWGGLAHGTAPLWLKKIVDRLVKRLNQGDVMLVRVKKNR